MCLAHISFHCEASVKNVTNNFSAIVGKDGEGASVQKPRVGEEESGAP